MDFYSSLNSSQLDVKKPTIFEIASCSQLDSLITPSIRFLLAHYTHQYPRVLIRILNNFDELNLLGRGIVEYNYLNTWNSTFIEKFYGIKRCSSKPIIPSSSDFDGDSLKFNEVSTLSRAQILSSLLDTVGLPYLDTKLQLYHEKLVPIYLMNQNTVNIPQEEQSNSAKDAKSRLPVRILSILCKLKTLIRNLFFKYYPIAKMSLKLISLFIYIMYLSNKTSSASIIQYLSKISYSRLTNADHQRVESIITPKKIIKFESNVPQTFTSIVLSNIKSLINPLEKIAWSTTDTILPASIFLLRFLEWYNANRNPDDDNDSLKKFTIPPAPKIAKSKFDEEFDEENKHHDSSICRICNQKLHNPGAIETGYVFCYKCIYEYLRDQSKEEGGVCPVTGRKLLGCSWSEIRNEWNVTNLRKVIL